MPNAQLKLKLWPVWERLVTAIISGNTEQVKCHLMIILLVVLIFLHCLEVLAVTEKNNRNLNNTLNFSKNSI